MKFWKLIQSLCICLLLWPSFALSESGLTLLGSSSGAATVVYSPATYYTAGTVQFWHDYSDSTKVLNSGGTSAGNGAGIQTVNPSLGSPTGSQTTAGSQPLVTTAVSNSKQAATYNGSKNLNITSATAILNSATKISFGTVFKLNGTSGNGQLYSMFDSGWNTPRFRSFLAGAQPSLDASQTSTAITTANASVILSTGVVHAILWQWDIAAGTLSIYADNAVTSINGASFGTAGSMSASSANGSAPLNTGVSLDADVFEIFMVTGSLQDSTQRTNWFAAVKSKFGITVY